MAEPKQASLRESVLESIGSFLYVEGFRTDEITRLGILEIINLISDYHEEGNALYPEVLITNSLDFFKTVPNKELVIKETNSTIEEFRNAIKLCAPLAINGWIIFIEITEKFLKFGIVSTEMTVTSPSIYKQTVGQMKVDDYHEITIAYLRNIGQKTVELSGLKNKLIVSLTLDEPKELILDQVQILSENICAKCDTKLIVNIGTYFEKLIDEALKSGHGNLIGVVDDNQESIDRLKEMITGKEGIYLSDPIDFEDLITYAEEVKNNESAVNLKSYSTVLKSMLNHDGITIMTNKARVLGYHILINNYVKPDDVVIGGARSRAFKSMENCGLFLFCFYKSQDGNIKVSKRDE